MTNPNPNPSTRFKKGYDPKRNLRGVPKETIEARKRARQIVAELLDMPNGQGETTRLDTMLRYMTGGKASPKDRENILKILYPGLLKDEIQHSGEIHHSWKEFINDGNSPDAE
jgi:hypothetical protein